MQRRKQPHQAQLTNTNAPVKQMLQPGRRAGSCAGDVYLFSLSFSTSPRVALLSDLLDARYAR